MLPCLYEGQDCSIARALEAIGERWTLLVIRDAFYGVTRFSDFQAHLDIPKAILSNRLRALTNTGILRRETDPDHPGRVRYRLTELGLELWPVVHALRSWGERYSPAEGGPRRIMRHAECGGTLDGAGSCRRCGARPSAHDVIAEPGPGLRAETALDPVSVALGAAHRLGDQLAPTERQPVGQEQFERARTPHAG